MNNYAFTLVLKNVDENTPTLEDCLYEAGCDDALINFRNGTVYLDFQREAKSMEEAVLSAIQAVESTTLGATVVSIAPDTLVTESEAAKRLHVKRQAILLWIKGERRKERPFPRPVMGLSRSSPLWRWREIVEWACKSEIIKDEQEAQNMLASAELIEQVNHALDARLIPKNLNKRLLSKLGQQHM